MFIGKWAPAFFIHDLQQLGPWTPEIKASNIGAFMITYTILGVPLKGSIKGYYKVSEKGTMI